MREPRLLIGEECPAGASDERDTCCRAPPARQVDYVTPRRRQRLFIYKWVAPPTENNSLAWRFDPDAATFARSCRGPGERRGPLEEDDQGRLNPRPRHRGTCQRHEGSRRAPPPRRLQLLPRTPGHVPPAYVRRVPPRRGQAVSLQPNPT
jgi:hypothetical protein